MDALRRQARCVSRVIRPRQDHCYRSDGSKIRAPGEGPAVWIVCAVLLLPLNVAYHKSRGTTQTLPESRRRMPPLRDDLTAQKLWNKPAWAARYNIINEN
ncbi:conserved hypothetical protein [Trichinella spiralis]|uniref:hypothetical protein n=1 Tax=Trichinella spiralis TaxID=6334 RepID=UPI0001EFB984|nr:conserved hypothetical protein [Trichinella spiralis]